LAVSLGEEKSEALKIIPIKRISVNVINCQISMLHAGNKEGMPVVLLYGIPTSTELWLPIIIKLAENGYRVYAPVLPGI
jgi:pimeloyl-ACP methyl ester carboxylesterase